MDMGFVVPPVRVRDNIQLRSNSYLVKLWDVEIAQGEILPRHLLAMNPGSPNATLPGAISTVEPALLSRPLGDRKPEAGSRDERIYSG